MSKLTKILIALGVLAVVAFLAVPPIIAAIRDDEDLEAELPDASTTAADSTDGTEPTTESTDASATTDATADSADGTWTVVAGDRDTYFVGYQIEETLRGSDITATGTTGDYTGSITVAGTTVETLELTVDLTTLQSDEGFRDDSIRSEGLETNTFPEATFTATAPITLSAAPAVGESVTATVTGDLTLHGVTREVTFDVEARWNGDTVDVTGEIPIVLADHDITAPARGFVSVRDEGKVVFVIQLAR